MTANYMHIGIPITEKKPNMTYNEAMKFWVSNVDDYDYKVEYLKFEEGTPSPRSCTAVGTWPTRWTTSTGTPTMPTASSAGPWTPAPACASPLSRRTAPSSNSTRIRTKSRSDAGGSARSALPARASLCRGSHTASHADCCKFEPFSLSPISYKTTLKSADPAFSRSHDEAVAY